MYDDLAHNEVHLWWADTDLILHPAVLERQFATLSQEERDRQRRFVFEKDRHRYLVSHAMVREALSRYAPVLPGDWQFAANAYGRPFIAEPAAFADLKFNLSHTHGKSVVAIGRGFEIGVDVERVRDDASLIQLAKRFFSPREMAQLAWNPGIFFDLWTLKEAYIKARGMGLAIPLDSFSFDLADPKKPTISFHEGCPGDPACWQFVLGRAGSGHRFALAASVPGDQPLTVAHREMCYTLR